MKRKHRGESNPPMSEHSLEIIEANRTAGGYFRFHLEFFETSSRRSTDGVWYSEVLKTMRYDPGFLVAWEDGNNAQDRRRMSAFDEVCIQVAKGVLFVHPKLNADSIVVVVHPKDEQAKSPVQAAARDREAAKAPKRAETRQERLELFRGIRERGGCGVVEAMTLWAQETQMSWWTIRRILEGEPEEEERRREVAKQARCG